MSLKKEASGRRSIQVEIEVPGTPEEVWQAIATGPGISAWFVPAEFEEKGGKPVAVKLNFGPGMESRSVVTAWDPPRMFAREGRGLGPGLAADRDRVQRRSAGGRRLRGPRGAKPVRQHGRLGRATDRLRSRAGPASSASCGSISRTSAGSAPRSCSSWLPSRERQRMPGRR